MLTGYWCEYAELGAGPVPGVRVVVDGRRIRTVERAAAPAATDHRLAGVVLPGFANAHSHAFHRALRGRTHDRGGTFWTWRERVYAVAARLTPDDLLALARATYAEMALAGVSCVGEFHYLHHPPGGGRYTDPNATGPTVVDADGLNALARKPQSIPAGRTLALTPHPGEAGRLLGSSAKEVESDRLRAAGRWTSSMPRCRAGRDGSSRSVRQ